MFECYRKGVFDRIDYVCKSHNAIHPLGFLVWIATNEPVMEVKRDIAIDDEKYALLLMPERGKHYISFEYLYRFNKDDQHKIDRLYEVERCKECNAYHETLSTLQKDYTKDKKNDLIKKQITKTQKIYNTHSESHPSITFDEIVEIIEIMDRSKFAKIVGKNVVVIEKETVYMFD